MSSVMRLFVYALLILSTPSYGQLTATPAIPDVLLKDKDLLDRYWSWLKIQTGAPDDLPWPTIVVRKLPSNIRMVLNYPTRSKPETPYEVRISEFAISRAANGQRLLVLSELGHELVHHVLLQKEHDWTFNRHVYNNATHGHCDTEFQTLAKHVSSVIWDAYHSNNLIRDVEQMTRKSCWESGQILSARD